MASSSPPRRRSGRRRDEQCIAPQPSPQSGGGIQWRTQIRADQADLRRFSGGPAQSRLAPRLVAGPQSASSAPRHSRVCVKRHNVDRRDTLIGGFGDAFLTPHRPPDPIRCQPSAPSPPAVRSACLVAPFQPAVSAPKTVRFAASRPAGRRAIPPFAQGPSQATLSPHGRAAPTGLASKRGVTHSCKRCSASSFSVPRSSPESPS